MDKIQLIIWSRDRPCQLETLLNSIQKFAPDIFDIDIIYSFSNENYLTGYKCLCIEYNKKVEFHNKENGSGKNLLLNLIEMQESNIVCFTTDDTILHKSVPCSPSKFMDNCDIFSLRLGTNTVVQNHVTGELQPVLINYSKDGDVISWNFQRYPALSNNGYPFGLDMVCYNKSMIKPLIQRCNFDKPPELESSLIRFRNIINPTIRSFEHSCAVNVPITNMTGITASVGISLEELNNQFLAGKKLRYKLDKPIVGCHQILEYEFV